MVDIYYTYQYKYKLSRLFYIYFLSRTDRVAEQMKEIYEQQMNVKLKLKKKKLVYVSKAPYLLELEQLETLRKGE